MVSHNTVGTSLAVIISNQSYIPRQTQSPQNIINNMMRPSRILVRSLFASPREFSLLSNQVRGKTSTAAATPGSVASMTFRRENPPKPRTRGATDVHRRAVEQQQQRQQKQKAHERRKRSDTVLNAVETKIATLDEASDPFVYRPKIAVLGVGGGGGNAVNNMIATDMKGVEFVVANTDAQALTASLASKKVQLGRRLTQGLGCGAKPEVGQQAAMESVDDVMEALGDANMVFITAGMGGGTGTGAAPVLAAALRRAGVLTVGVVSTPFRCEGVHRLRLAKQGISLMHDAADCMIVLPNQNLVRAAGRTTSMLDSFKHADAFLKDGVRGVVELITQPGVINLDFADVRAVMNRAGRASMGTGEADGPGRAVRATEMALLNPLLGDITLPDRSVQQEEQHQQKQQQQLRYGYGSGGGAGASGMGGGEGGVLVTITSGDDLTLFEVDAIMTRIRQDVSEDANVIFGTSYDPLMTNGSLRVSVVITGVYADDGLASVRAGRVGGVGGQPAAVAAASTIPTPPEGGGWEQGGGRRPVVPGEDAVRPGSEKRKGEDTGGGGVLSSIFRW